LETKTEPEPRAQQEKIVNNFTIQAATVNGSGSQSANLVLTRALIYLGIPVSPKSIFPSNIEGLPTWYQLRVSEHGYQCRQDQVDVLIAINPATWAKDITQLVSGGVVIYEEGFPFAKTRDDIIYYPVPFAKIAKEHFPNDKLKKYLTNMIYVGVVSAMLGIPEQALVAALQQQFRTKPKAVESNMNAIRLGIDYWNSHLSKQDKYYIEPLNKTKGKILMDGNTAAALGCIMGGYTVAAWYPITPSSSLCETLESLSERFRRDENGKKKYAIIQAEDELAALGIAIGAGWAGARAMTSTSGPGISLMAENTGLAYYAEIPVVIFDIQRVGPSTGLPTRTSQGDISFVYQLSHGDTKHLVLIPGNVTECYLFAQEAFDIAEEFQTPVFVLSDLDLGMNQWMIDPLPYPEKPFSRGRVLDEEQIAQFNGWGRYKDVDGTGIPYRTIPGNRSPKAGYFTRGSGHNEYAMYSEDPDDYRNNMDRLARKFETARERMPEPIVDSVGSEYGLIAFGSSHFAVEEAREKLSQASINLDYLRIRALPFSHKVAEFIEAHKVVFVVEQNRDGQMYSILRSELPGQLADRLKSIRYYTGLPMPASAIIKPIGEFFEVAL